MKTLRDFLKSAVFLPLVTGTGTVKNCNDMQSKVRLTYQIHTWIKPYCQMNFATRLVKLTIFLGTDVVL